MKSTIIAALPFLAAALAAPTARRSEYDISITLTNDQTGAGIAKGVPSGNYPNSIDAIWGPFHASSAQLNSVNPKGNHVSCNIVIGESTFVLSTEQTWVDLDAVPGPGLVDLSAATVACYVNGEVITKRLEFDINVTLFNDQSGANDVRGVPSDADISIKGLFAGSKLDVNGRVSASCTHNTTKFSLLHHQPTGRIQASAAQLATVSLPGNPEIDCQIRVGGRVVAFNNSATWIDLDGVAGPGLVDLTEGTVFCTVE